MTLPRTWMRPSGQVSVWVGLLTMVGCMHTSSASQRIRPRGPRAVYDAVVTEAHGVELGGGDRCRVSVTATNHPQYNCRIVVQCGGDTHYGLPNAGYNRCARAEPHGRFVAARDEGGTRADGDPKMSFEWSKGRVVVEDEHPNVRIELALRRQPVGVAPWEGEAPGATSYGN